MAASLVALPTNISLFNELDAAVVPSLLEIIQSEVQPSKSVPLPQDIVSDYGVEQISETIPDFIKTKISEESLEEGFFVFDFGALISQFNKWHKLMPRVEPFYAVKCNPHPAILRMLASLGTGFDCASKHEMSLVKELVSDHQKNLIFANPCKHPLHIQHARQEGVEMMTFDNIDELKKIKAHFPEAKLILRILPDDSHSLCKFGTKFGAAAQVWPIIFQTAVDLKLDIVGISFHVGSGCGDASAYDDALRLARSAFDLAEQYGFNFTFLDIGGGFPGTDEHTPSFPDIAEVVTPLLDKLFPPHVRVIGEPGRYFAASAMTLATTIHSRRVFPTEENEQKKVLYYIDDGVYGSFNCIFFDHQSPKPLILNEKDSHDDCYISNIFGPTCDSLDLVAKEVLLPELEVGEWLMFNNMGAYTTAAASSFNGFRTTRTFYVHSHS